MSDTGPPSAGWRAVYDWLGIEQDPHDNDQEGHHAEL